MTNKYKDIKMKTSTTKRSEEGFAAVTVMVISLLGGLIVFDTVKENINQERMAGNYSKELNARLQAENGLAAAYNALSANSSISNTEMMTALNTNTSTSYRYTLDAWENSADTSIMELDSKGAHYEGNYKIRGSMKPGASGGTSVYTGPITMCEGASLVGAGAIDSYISSDGAYGGTSDDGDVNITNEGDVSILSSNSTLNLSNGTRINGDVSVNGNLNLVDGYIYGDAYAYNSGSINNSAGDITVAGSGSAAIGGNITATGDVSYGSYASSVIPDSITANGNTSFEGSYYDGPVSYGDTISGNYDSDNAEQSDGLQISDQTAEVCDPLNLAGEFTNTIDGIANLKNDIDNDLVEINSLPFSNSNGVTDITLTETNDTISINGTGVSPIPINFLGDDSTPVYVIDLSGLSNNDYTLTIASDITIYVPASETSNWTGSDYLLDGHIKIENGASLNVITDSSLYLKASITGLNEDGTTSNSAVNANNDSYFNLYSGYDSDTTGKDGLTVANGGSGVMTVYAPKADITMAGAGTIYGSVLGNSLDINNGAGIHYDEAIGDSNAGSINSGSSEITITRWF